VSSSRVRERGVGARALGEAMRSGNGQRHYSALAGIRRSGSVDEQNGLLREHFWRHETETGWRRVVERFDFASGGMEVVASQEETAISHFVIFSTRSAVHYLESGLSRRQGSVPVHQ
jgi:hypothetical protein